MSRYGSALVALALWLCAACLPTDPLSPNARSLSSWFLTPGEWSAPLVGSWHYSLPIRFAAGDRFEINAFNVVTKSCIRLVAVYDPPSYKGMVRTAHFDILYADGAGEGPPVEQAELLGVVAAFRDDIGDDAWASVSFRMAKWRFEVLKTLVEPFGRYLGKLVESLPRDPSPVDIAARLLTIPAWIVLALVVVLVIGRLARLGTTRRPRAPPSPPGVLGRLAEGRTFYLAAAALFAAGVVARLALVVTPIPNATIAGSYDSLLVIDHLYQVHDIKHLLHPPLYGYLAYLFEWLFGAPESVGSMRFYLVSLVASVASMPLVADAARRLFGTRSAALVALVVMALTILDIELVELDDTYATSQLTVAFLLWTYARARQSGALSDVVGFALGIGLVVWASYSTSVILVAFLPLVLVDRESALGPRHWAVALGGAALMVAPLVPLVVKGVAGMLEMGGVVSSIPMEDVATTVQGITHELVPVGLVDGLQVATNSFPDASYVLVHAWLLVPMAALVAFAAVRAPRRLPLRLVIMVLVGVGAFMALSSVMRVNTWNLVSLATLFALVIAGASEGVPRWLGRTLVGLTVVYYLVGFWVTTIYEARVLFKGPASFMF